MWLRGLAQEPKSTQFLSSKSWEHPTSIFIKPFIKRFFLIISAGAQGFFHSYLCLPTCHMTPCYILKSTRTSQEAANTRDSKKKKKKREREREKPQVSILNNVILTNNKQGGFICSLSPSAWAELTAPQAFSQFSNEKSQPISGSWHQFSGLYDHQNIN